jgi:D-tyrosyl-tRNA(Tyr) deacylase
MIGLIQRVSQASVSVDEKNIGKISKGILILLGVEKLDTEENVRSLLTKVINYRIFEDENQKMNHSLLDIKGELLIVPQFTLPANTNKGTRPSFASAAPPDLGRALYNEFIKAAQAQIDVVATGRFGADMQVSLINSGPVTFWLQK